MVCSHNQKPCIASTGGLILVAKENPVTNTKRALLQQSGVLKVDGYSFKEFISPTRTSGCPARRLTSGLFRGGTGCPLSLFFPVRLITREELSDGMPYHNHYSGKIAGLSGRSRRVKIRRKSFYNCNRSNALLLKLGWRCLLQG